MNRRAISVWITFAIFFSTAVIMVDVSPNVSGQTTYYVDDVPGNGPGNPPEDFTSIQDAINASNTGDTVFVYNGTYYENVLVNATIDLTGENVNSTIIDGGGVGDVMKIINDYANVSGFKITNSGDSSGDAGLELNNVRNCRISNNNISGNHLGIRLQNSTDNDILNNIVVMNNSTGIAIRDQSDFNVLSENNVSNNGYGISITASSENNSLLDNDVSHNLDGITITFTHGNKLIANHVFINSRYGITLWTVFDTLVYNNNASFNEYGIYFHQDSENNNITGNDVFSNGKDGIILWDSDNNNITDNRANMNNWSGIRLYSSFNNNMFTNTCNYNKYGILFQNSNLNNITENNISSNSYYGINLEFSRINDIIGNKIILNKNDGIYLEQSDENNITCNNISSNEDDGISLDGSYKNKIIGNNISLNFDDGIYLSSSDGNIITANNISSNTNTSTFITSSNWNNITFCDISYNSEYGVYLVSNSNNNKVENNSVNNNQDGIYVVSQSEDNHIICNKISANSRWGIVVQDANSNTIDNNTITFSTTPSTSGIYVIASFNTAITNNSISHNYNGVVIGSSSGSVVAKNTITSNLDNGIYMLDSANDNTITDNMILDNTDDGIKIWQCTGNTIVGNNISNNGYWGMALIDCSSNEIYHNNFMNIKQGQDNTDTNNWDSGYPSGGNHWSDYAGEDLKWGPYQDIPGSDDIGDVPYDIDDDSRDRYPLMVPSELFVPRTDDGTPLTIFLVAVDELTDNSVTIKWQTTKYSDSRVNWSQNPDLSANSTSYVRSFNHTHSVTLTSLAPNTTYYFEVTSMDAFGNIATNNNGTVYYHFTTMSEDVSPPDISDVSYYPQTPEVQGDANITANVTDNNMVYSVWINITDSTGSSVGNFSMEQNVLDGRYYYESTFSQLGMYTFVIWANDSAGNWEFSAGQFEMFDTTPPEIIDPIASPSTGDVFGFVNLTVIVVDNCEVSSVWTHITDPNNETAGNFSMSYNTSIGRFEYISTYDIPGTYTYNIWAQDTLGNWNSTLPRNLWFQVWDVTTPGIVPQVYPSPQEYGGAVNITALITDDVGIGAVWVRVIGPDGSELENATMQRFGTTDIHWYNSTYPVLGGLNYTIWAFDSTGNSASVTGPFKIVDTTPPVANAGSDMNVATGTTVSLNGNQSRDNHAIENYSWHFTYGANTVTLYGISPSFKFEMDGYYTVLLTAKDISGNSASDSILVIVVGLDSDGDGLSDYEEGHVYGTDPSNPDTDGDGRSDGDEVVAGTDPLVFDETDKPKESDIDDVCWFFALLALIVILMMAYVLWPKKERPRKKDDFDLEEEWDHEEKDTDLVPMDEDGKTYGVAPTKPAKPVPEEEPEIESRSPKRPPNKVKKSPPRPPR